MRDIRPLVEPAEGAHAVIKAEPREHVEIGRATFVTLLPDLQLRELASHQREPDDVSDAHEHDPTAPCWELVQSGDAGETENITPPLIFENALQLNNYGEVQGIKGTFKNWVTDVFNNRDADALVTILERNLPVALAWDEDARTLCREAFARLCLIARVVERA